MVEPILDPFHHQGRVAAVFLKRAKYFQISAALSDNAGLTKIIV